MLSGWGGIPFFPDQPCNILTGKAYYSPCEKPVFFTILKLQWFMLKPQ